MRLRRCLSSVALVVAWCGVAVAARAEAHDTPVAAPVADVDDGVAYPPQGAGTFSVARSGGRAAGTQKTYRVAVEGGILGITADTFADQIAPLVDARRVGDGEPFDFTVYLATPVTRDELCGGGYDRYTSCVEGDRVVINVERWELGEPGFDAGLPAYRRATMAAETHGEPSGDRIVSGT